MLRVSGAPVDVLAPPLALKAPLAAHPPRAALVPVPRGAGDTVAWPTRKPTAVPHWKKEKSAACRYPEARAEGHRGRERVSEGKLAEVYFSIDHSIPY